MPDLLDMTARYVPDPDAMESRLGDETVILHLGSGTYFGLDSVGTVVWDALQPGATPEALCARVRQRFADAPTSTESEVMAFLAQLLDHALIRRA